MSTLRSSFSWVKASRIRIVREDRGPDVCAARVLADELLSSSRGAFFAEALPIADRVCWQPYRKALFSLARQVKSLLADHRMLTDRDAVGLLLLYVRKLYQDKPELIDLVTDFADCMRTAGRGASRFDLAAQRCASPATWPPVNEDPRVNHLLALCRELADASADGVFFLSCRTAETVCGFSSHQRAAESIRWLVKAGYVELASKRKAGQAQEFRQVRNFRT